MAWKSACFDCHYLPGDYSETLDNLHEFIWSLSIHSWSWLYLYLSLYTACKGSLQRFQADLVAVGRRFPKLVNFWILPFRQTRLHRYHFLLLWYLLLWCLLLVTMSHFDLIHLSSISFPLYLSSCVHSLELLSLICDFLSLLVAKSLHLRISNDSFHIGLTEYSLVKEILVVFCFLSFPRILDSRWEASQSLITSLSTRSRLYKHLWNMKHLDLVLAFLPLYRLLLASISVALMDQRCAHSIPCKP